MKTAKLDSWLLVWTQGEFNHGSRRGKEADFGAKNTSASLPRRLRGFRRFLNSRLVWTSMLILCALIATGCRSPRVGGVEVEELRKWYVPSETTTRRAVVPPEQVAYLDAVPTDRKYRVIGFVSPPAGRFRSWGELLNGVRAAASLYGAEAVFVDSEKEMAGWGFNFSQFGGGGGKWRAVQIRAKAIVWE